MNFYNKNFLILGAGGFIGTNLALALQKANAKVIGYGRKAKFPKIWQNMPFIEGNLHEPEKYQPYVANADYIFHLLGDSSPGNSSLNPSRAIDTIKASLDLLDICKDNKVKKIIFASSGGSVYGRPSILPIPENIIPEPICSYGINMLMVEKYLALYKHLYGLNYTILRIANPYGQYQLNIKNQGIIAAIIENVINDKNIEIWGDGSVVRDFIYIDDVIDAFLKAATYNGNYNLFNVGSGIGRSISQVVDDLEAQFTQKKINKVYKPSRKIDIEQNYLDISLIFQETGWCPRKEWSSGLAETKAWMESYLSNKPELLSIEN